MTKEKSIRKLCEDANVSWGLFYYYRKKHPTLSNINIINLLVQKQNIPNATKSIMEKTGVSRTTIYKYRKKYPHLTNDELVRVLNNRNVEPDKEKLKISYSELIASQDIITLECKLRYSEINLKEKCLATGVSYKQAVDYRRYYKANHGKVLSDNDIIIHYLTRRKPFKAKCREHGIHPQTATNYKTSNPHLTDDEIIKHFLDKKANEETVTFADKCRQANISYRAALIHRRKHPELTDEQVILHYNPYCYYSIQGEFIIVPLQKE